MEREKIFVKHKSDNGLISKIYKKLSQLNSKKTNNLIKKWAKIWKDMFPKKKRANRYMKKYTISLVIREMQIKTTMESHVTLVKMSFLKKPRDKKKKCWQGCGERECLYTVVGNVSWSSHCGKQYGDSSRNYK